MENLTIESQVPVLNKINGSQVSEINFLLKVRDNVSYENYKGEAHLVRYDQNIRGEMKPCLAVYRGNSKVSKSYYYATIERREEAAQEAIASADRHFAWKEEQKAEKKKIPQLEVGDVLSTSWGYEQTNVEFYQVIEKVGVATVVLRQVGSETVGEPTSWCSENRKPVKDAFIGEPIKKRVGRWGCKMNRSATASKTDWTSSHHVSWGH